MYILTVGIYAVLIFAWGYILFFASKRIRLLNEQEKLLRILFLVLGIDAFRTLFESVYFGGWYASLSGILPRDVYEFLVLPSSVLVPKLVTLLSALVIILVLFRRWLPEELLGRDQLYGRIDKLERTVDARERDLERIDAMRQEDIAQRMQTEELLRHSRNVQSRILRGISAGILVCNRETDVVESVDDVAVEILQTPAEALRGRRIDDLLQPDGTMEYPEQLEAEAEECHRLFIYVPGHIPRLYLQRLTVTDFINGEPKHINIIFDVTRRVEMERRLGLAEKMEALGRLSAGIVHEINTPAQYVLNNLKFMENRCNSVMALATDYHALAEKGAGGSIALEDFRQVDERWPELDMGFLEEEIPAALEQSREGIERVAHIVAALKKFSHPSLDRRQHADINEALSLAATITKNEWKYHSELSLDLAQDLPHAPVFLNEINQVFLNILVNAAHANTEKHGGGQTKGRIHVRTRNHEDCVAVEIEDTGGGIPAAIRNKVFEPFFTTKEAGKGTGQGLAIAHAIVVEKHGGSLELSSDEGKGTCVSIRLPLTPPDNPEDGC